MSLVTRGLGGGANLVTCGIGVRSARAVWRKFVRNAMPVANYLKFSLARLYTATTKHTL